MARLRTHDLDTGAIAPRRGEVELPPRAPARRKLAALAAISVMAIGAGGALFSLLVSPAFIDGYNVQGNTLIVAYAPPGGCDEMVRVHARETGTAVVLDIAGYRLPLPSNAMQPICTVNFELSRPLGDRELRLADGRTVKQAWAEVGR